MSFLPNDLLQDLLEFRDERDWRQFHTPRNLAASISIEASELLECFQWARDGEVQELVSSRREAIEDEVADIAILLSYFCHDLEIDLTSAVQRKLAKNHAKYPPDRARGNSAKYDQL